MQSDLILWVAPRKIFVSKLLKFESIALEVLSSPSLVHKIRIEMYIFCHVLLLLFLFLDIDSSVPTARRWVDVILADILK